MTKNCDRCKKNYPARKKECPCYKDNPLKSSEVINCELCHGDFGHSSDKFRLTGDHGMRVKIICRTCASDFW